MVTQAPRMEAALPAVAEKWGYGFSASDGEYLGARSTGAVGSTLRSGVVWASRSYTHEVGRGVALEGGSSLEVRHDGQDSGRAEPARGRPERMRAGTRTRARGCDIVPQSALRARARFARLTGARTRPARCCSRMLPTERCSRRLPVFGLWDSVTSARPAS